MARNTQVSIFNLSSQHLAQYHPPSSLLLSALLLAGCYCWRRLHGKAVTRPYSLTSVVSSAHSLASLSFIIITCCFGITPPEKPVVTVLSNPSGPCLHIPKDKERSDFINIQSMFQILIFYMKKRCLEANLNPVND